MGCTEHTEEIKKNAGIYPGLIWGDGAGVDLRGP